MRQTPPFSVDRITSERALDLGAASLQSQIAIAQEFNIRAPLAGSISPEAQSRLISNHS
jgi:hypothetical protein